MLIRKYGVTLSRLTENDIELVREKRNSLAIRQRMIFQKQIDGSMQKKWFSTIDNPNNNYFLIEYENKKIGLVNGKEINFKKRSSEGGIFIWAEEYESSLVPVMCSFIMNDYTFLINNFSNSYIKILRTNTNAILYNRALGYEPARDKKEHDNYEWYVLTKERYLSKTQKYRNVIASLTNDSNPLTEDDFSFSNVNDADMKRLYGALPPDLKAKINHVLSSENRKLI